MDLKSWFIKLVNKILKNIYIWYNFLFLLGTYFGSVVDGLSKFFITKIKGFNVDQMCVMTLLFEGDEDEVKTNEKKIFGVARMFGGMSAGETNGERGYMLTFVIAYLRVSNSKSLNCFCLIELSFTVIMIPVVWTFVFIRTTLFLVFQKYQPIFFLFMAVLLYFLPFYYFFKLSSYLISQCASVRTFDKNHFLQYWC